VFRHVKFAELPVVDQDRALRFYTEKLGLSVAVDSAYAPDWRWLEFAIPGAATKILVTRRESAPRSEPAIILVVEDVNDAVTTLKGRGVEFTQEPTSAPWAAEETFALLRDSEDNIVMLGSA
jgi:predicted enzyme related to lactoylglutathione lyase